MNTEHTPDDPPQLDFRPRGASAGNLKLKMLMLIGMLAMVFFAMHEAGKPENWEWMNFPKTDPETAASPTTVDNVASTGDASSPSVAPEPEPRKKIDAATENSTVSNKPFRLADNSDLRFAQPCRNFKSEIPTESAKFWRQVFSQIELKQRFELMDLLNSLLLTDRLSNGNPATKLQSALVDSVKKRRVAFDDELLDAMTSLPDSSEEKSLASEAYFNADKFWRENILPALDAFTEQSDITLSQQQRVLALRNFLDNESLEFVQDNTAVGWTGDSLAWSRSWSKIHAGLKSEPNQVSRIQLIAQPSQYRGEVVSVRGFVRSIETRTAKSGSSIMPGGQPGNYFIVWLKPFESEAGPYCVYCVELPSDLPKNNEQLASFDSLAVVEGMFFKNRSYQAASGEVLACPLILAKSFELAQSRDAGASTLFWQPSKTTSYVLAFLIPLLAICGTWLAFQASRTRKRLPSEQAEHKLGIFLEDLKDDPNVQTDLQKVATIKEHEDEIQ